MSFATWSGGNSVGHGGSNIHPSTIASFADVKLAQKFITSVQQNDIKMIRKIAKSKGFNANILFRFEGGMEKMSALHYAAKEGYTVVVRELLELGCDVNVSTPFDMVTPLHMGCQMPANENTKTIIQDLLSSGAEVNRGDHSGRTPLILAAELGNFELVRMLLYYGADINAKYSEVDMPEGMRHSLHSGMLSEREIDEMCDPYRGNSALLQAAREHHADIVQDLLSRGCDSLLVNATGNTALHLACKSESCNTYSGPLVRAPVATNPALVTLLLKYPCLLNGRNKHQETPLKRAIDGIFEIAVWNIPIEDKIEESKNFFETINILIGEGCDANLSYEGSTALQCLTNTNLIAKYNCLVLEQTLVKTLYRLVAAGCSVQPSDTETCSRVIPSRSQGSLLNFLQEAAQSSPPSLKMQAKWALRKLCAKPLVLNLSTLGLPAYLSQYAALEVIN